MIMDELCQMVRNGCKLQEFKHTLDELALPDVSRFNLENREQTAELTQDIDLSVLDN